MSSPFRREPRPWLPELGSALAEALPRLYGTRADGPLGALIDALLRALERGELAIDLEGPAPEGISSEGWPEVHRRALETSPLARSPHGPLALEGSLLRWRRWQGLHQEVREALIVRAQRRNPGAAADWRPPRELGDRQQILAIRTALERDLLVLAGGPGTGKTSTVARLLEAVNGAQPTARIHLAAPTGKAAARLRAATGQRWACTTLHQLLESTGEGRFRRNQNHLLPLDLLVVDEVSMVDLALLAALLRALPEQARLVLVGDPAQLPPIAPGAPLQELLQDREEGLQEAVVTLETTYRNAGAIAAVASALREEIREGGGHTLEPPENLAKLLGNLEPEGNLHWQEAPPGALPATVVSQLEEQLRQLEAATASCAPGKAEGWGDLARVRDGLLVLCPRKRGPWGVEAVHRQLLGEAFSALNQWPSGTPVLCTRNLQELGLSNGDLGVLVVREERWLVFGQEAPIWVHPSQLPGALEPALALTVHKAQGSEAEQVVVLLPEPESVDQRLLYTALTRARREAWLHTAPL